MLQILKSADPPRGSRPCMPYPMGEVPIIRQFYFVEKNCLWKRIIDLLYENTGSVNQCIIYKDKCIYVIDNK